MHQKTRQVTAACSSALLAWNTLAARPLELSCSSELMLRLRLRPAASLGVSTRYAPQAQLERGICTWWQQVSTEALQTKQKDRERPVGLVTLL